MKKSNMYEKAKKSGVVEGGIKPLTKILNERTEEKFKSWPGDLVRVNVKIPSSLRRAYKSILASTGDSYQSDLEDHIIRVATKK